MTAPSQSSAAKNPWMKWYPSDWRADPKLRMCSIAARGLWAEMIALMHEAKPYGHLQIAGTTPSDRQLAALVGAPIEEVGACLIELEEAEVFSRTEGGVIFSRRMVRDRAKAETQAANGKRGGNPGLKVGDKRKVNPPVKGGNKAQKPEARDQSPDYSEPNGSAPPIQDFKTAVFDHGLDWLARRLSRPPYKLRSILGKWCRDYGDMATAEAILSAQRESAVDPIAWINKTLESRNGTPNRMANSYAQTLAKAFASDDTSP